MKRASSNAGFTLIEIVVAISLMSLVMLTMFEGMRIAANGMHRGQQKLEEQARSMSGLDAMEHQVGAAAIRIFTQVGSDNKPVQVIGFAGTPGELRFCTRASWRGDQSRPQFLADYRVVRTTQGQQQLAITEMGLTDDRSVVYGLGISADSIQGGEMVGDPADRIEFAYYQPQTQTMPGQWVSTWRPMQDAELPRAVRVRWTRGQKTEDATFLVAIHHEPRLQ